MTDGTEKAFRPDKNIEELRRKTAFICDMDGVIYHGSRLLDGVQHFVEWLQRDGKNFIFLTNSSERSPRELRQRLARMKLEVDESHFYTSALATADFLARQSPGAGVYAIGESGLLNALYDSGLTMNDVDPEYVVVGETRSYNYEKLERAVHLIRTRGAKLVGTNPDPTGPGECGIVPACGSLVKPIEMSSGVNAYFVGKPNPLMMRHALKRLDALREDTAIIGDRMDTDIIAGVESEIETVLVLSGVTDRADLVHFAYRPGYVLSGVGEIPG
ncbi:MAG: HAD-IIA family hydrolase [Planctomycetota bacterium]|jgi:NagD protein|nr:HAD-IIA family hydrolase [Planctomycetota bacterium]